MKYIIGNWKAHKTLKETDQWLTSFLANDFSILKNQIQFVICPPFPFITHILQKITSIDEVKLGAQNISHFPFGAYTGEVTGYSLKSLVSYVLIGHSERRQFFDETDDMLIKKVQQAQEFVIEPVFCVRNVTDTIPSGVKFLAYEPVHAIGTGQNEPIENVLQVRTRLNLPNECKFIYGGSVNEKNIAQYLLRKEIDGVLPGGASLNPETFFKLALATIAQ